MRISKRDLIERVASKKIRMSVTSHPISVKRAFKVMDKSKRIWEVSKGYSENPLQTILLCKHNDSHNSRYDQEVIRIHPSGKVEITSGSQKYPQPNLSSAISFLVKVADQERAEIMRARQEGVEISLLRPDYVFSV